MGAISGVEDYLIARIKTDPMGPKLRAVESLPGVWDDATLDRILLGVPGAFVSFIGGGGGRSGTHVAALDSRWAVYAVTGHASGEAARRRGDAHEIGAYEIIERVVPLFHGHTIPDVGGLSLLDVTNLFTDRADAQGVSIYAAIFSLTLALPVLADQQSLDEFATFNADWDLEPTDGNTDATDTQTGLNQ